MTRKLMIALALVASGLVAAPVAAMGSEAKTQHAAGHSFGSTALTVDPGTLEALVSLGVSPGVVPPARLNGATYTFPITNSLGSALRSGVVSHVGGISLSVGTTTVRLTDFQINLAKRLLYGKVNGSGPVALLDLDYSRLAVTVRHGTVVVGPVGTTLTQGAADALNSAFGTDALGDETAIGDARIRYRLFG